MKIVGGVYKEICIDPMTQELYGSGLRAAIAVSQGCDDLILVGLVDPELKKEMDAISKGYGFDDNTQERQKEISFVYDTPLSSPRIYGIGDYTQRLDVSESNMLVFAMVEASISAKADHLVIDPQGLSKLEERITWLADHLAIVGNRREIIKLLDEKEDIDTEVLAEKARERYQAEVVVIKCGALGAIVSDFGKIYHIGAYYTNKVNPIGSGDVFSGVFAYYWARLRTSAEVAAKNASQATAEWVHTGPLQVVNKKGEVSAPNAVEPIFGKKSTVYLAAPFFTVSERWMVDLCRNALKDLGATVFSPLHDVGVGSTEGVVSADIEGLVNSNCIFALLDGMDPGTLFEIGFGTALNKNITVYTSDKDSSNLTMIRGSGVQVRDDLASAIYNAIWQGIPQNKSK